MRFLYIVCSVLSIIMCIMMQQQSVEAKPFIFFLPQAPPRSGSNLPAPSPSFTTNIDFTSILSNKLNLLTSLLQSGLNSGGFTFGFNKVLPTVQATAVAMKVPNLSTTNITPDTVFKPESIASAVPTVPAAPNAPIASTTSTAPTTSTASPSFRTLTTTTESSKTIEKDSGAGSKAATDKNINDNIASEVITKQIDNEGSANSGNKVTTDNSGNEYPVSSITSSESQINDSDGHVTSKVIDGRNNNNSGNNNDNSDTISRVTTDKTNGYEYVTPKIGYSYDSSNHAMNENEISNEIMMINNQYLPAF